MDSVASPEAANHITPINAGHMLYRKCLVQNEHEGVFIKAFEESLFTDPVAREHSLGFLRKEFEIYTALRRAGFHHLPTGVAFEEDVLYLSAHAPEDGWHWELPEDPAVQEEYVNAVLAALTELEAQPTHVLPEFTGQASLDEFLTAGWLRLGDQPARQAIIERLFAFQDDLHPHVHGGAKGIYNVLSNPAAVQTFTEIAMQHCANPRLFVAHFDARQSNIAWHPEYGVSIVDWSWASAAPARTDRTMFVIDLFKSGCDVTNYMSEHFDSSHATTLLGHWLARSIAPTPTDDLTVRFHQLASAASAATLLQI